jgi:ParB family transcriptional regulator, chromosome partitioning protein
MAKEALGRGLGALLGEIEEAYENEMPRSRNDIKELSLADIKPNPFQPRKHFDLESLNELAESIKTHGLLQPVVVVKDGTKYLLVAGERRWRASKLAKAKSIKAIVVTITEEQMREHALIENIQREELNIMELAQAYEELIKVHDLTHDELSQMIHKSRTHITNTLRLLQLNKKVQKALVEGKVTMGHAKVMVGLDEKEQILVMNSIIGQKLSVREVESLVKSFKEQTPSKTVSKQKSPIFELENIVHKLQKMGLKTSQSSNKITIDFTSQELADIFYAALK